MELAGFFYDNKLLGLEDVPSCPTFVDDSTNANFTDDRYEMMDEEQIHATSDLRHFSEEDSVVLSPVDKPLTEDARQVSNGDELPPIRRSVDKANTPILLEGRLPVKDVTVTCPSLPEERTSTIYKSTLQGFKCRLPDRSDRKLEVVNTSKRSNSKKNDDTTDATMLPERIQKESSKIRVPVPSIKKRDVGVKTRSDTVVENLRCEHESKEKRNDPDIRSIQASLGDWFANVQDDVANLRSENDSLKRSVDQLSDQIGVLLSFFERRDGSTRSEGSPVLEKSTLNELSMCAYFLHRYHEEQIYFTYFTDMRVIQYFCISKCLYQNPTLILEAAATSVQSGIQPPTQRKTSCFDEQYGNISDANCANIPAPESSTCCSSVQPTGGQVDQCAERATSESSSI